MKQAFPATNEADVEAWCVQLFTRYGWFPLKTDSGLVMPGGGRQRLQAGFPDRVFLLGLPQGLCLAAVIEFKRPKGGKLRTSQEEMHKKLRQQYGIEPHVVNDPQQVMPLIQQGLALAKLLKKEAA